MYWQIYEDFMNDSQLYQYFNANSNNIISGELREYRCP